MFEGNINNKIIIIAIHLGYAGGVKLDELLYFLVQVVALTTNTAAAIAHLINYLHLVTESANKSGSGGSFWIAFSYSE